jgi:hypothetical protein
LRAAQWSMPVTQQQAAGKADGDEGEQRRPAGGDAQRAALVDGGQADHRNAEQQGDEGDLPRRP